MKVIEASGFRSEDGTISLENRVRGTLKHGLRWYGEMQAQQFVSQRLEKALGSDHVLLRNQSVPGTFHVLPLVLLGPQGVRVLLATSARGVFRAKGEEWMRFDGGSRHFRRTRPNLQTEVITHAKIVLDLLKERGYPLPEVEAVLILANPRTHVDTARPAVRVVLADAIDHFAANLLQFPAIMNQGDIDLLVEALTVPPKTPEPEPPPLPAPPAGRAAPPRPTPPIEGPMPSPSRRPRRRRMSGMQWLLLGFLLLVQLAVIGLFAFLLLSGNLLA